MIQKKAEIIENPVLKLFFFDCPKNKKTEVTQQAKENTWKHGKDQRPHDVLNKVHVNHFEGDFITPEYLNHVFPPPDATHLVTEVNDERYQGRKADIGAQ